MTLKRLTIACALTSTLAACGGGGAPTNSNNTSTPSGAPSHLLTGVGSKGLIKDGIVKVYAVDAAGNRSGAPIATTRTSKADGNYTLDLGARTGMFMIEISADAGTTMDDEYSGTIAMPSGMTMRSLIQLDGNSTTTVSGNVTPFTEMLVAAAISASPTGALTADNVATAQVEVTKVLGFNPLTTKPLNSNSDAAATTSDAAEKLQAVALAAVSQIAHSNGMGCNGSDSEKIKCAVAATAGSAVMKDGALSMSGSAKDALLAGLVAAAKDPVVNKTTVKTLAGQSLLALGAASPSAPKTAVATAQTPSSEAKALFASLRTNLQAWSDSSQNGGLRHSIDTMKADFDNAVAPLDQSLVDWVELSGRGIKLFNNFVDHKSRLTTVTDGSGEAALGSCTLFKDDAGLVAMTSSDVLRVLPRSVGCTMTAKTVPHTERTVGTNLYSRDQINRVITLTSNGSSAFSYTAKTQRLTQQYKKTAQGTSYAFTTQSSKVIGSVANGTIAYTLNGDAVTSAAIGGYMPGRTDADGIAITDREAWDVKFSITPESGGVNKYALSGSIDAQKGGVSLGAVVLRNTSFVRAISSDGDYRVLEAKLAVGVTAGSSAVDGVLYLNQFGTDKYGNSYAPAYAQFSGEFTNTRGESFKGVITAEVLNYKNVDSLAPSSPSNFTTDSMAFSGTLKISQRPALTVTFAKRSTGYQSDEFNASYNDGSNVISFDGNNSLPRALNISSATGINVKWVEGATFLDVFKNNTKAALLNLKTKTINYADGSFETFN